MLDVINWKVDQTRTILEDIVGIAFHDMAIPYCCAFGDVLDLRWVKFVAWPDSEFSSD